MGTLHCNVVILRCGDVAGTSFSQRCEINLLTTLYVVFMLCVCWGVTTALAAACMTFTHNDLLTIVYLQWFTRYGNIHLIENYLLYHQI